MDWYLKVLKNYVGFRGRARRKEYWMFILVNIIFTFVLGLLDKMLGWQRAGGEGILTTIYGILVFLPWWAVQFRRLHDYSAAIFLIPICISFDTAEKRRYATYLILNRRFSFEF